MIKTNTELIIAKSRGKKFESDSKDTVRIQNLFYYSCLEFGFQLCIKLMLRRLPVLINLISIKSKLSSVKLHRKNFHVRYYSQMKPTLQLRIDTILIVLDNCVKIKS